MLVRDLIAGTDVRARDAADGAVRICDITDDSRTVLPGSLFIARRGLTNDGRRFIGDAIHAGAGAVLTDDPTIQIPPKAHAAILITPNVADAFARLSERFYGNPSSGLALIGVTGTNGKTTITYLIRQMLNARGLRCGLIGTVEIDDGVEVGPATMTTPPPSETSRTLAIMTEAACRACAMEVSSHALDQDRVSGLTFRVGIFTNLTGDHLDYHGTIERYTAAKARLFGMLREDGLAIVNADDPASETMLKECRARVVRCTLDPDRAGKGWAAARIISESMGGTRAEFTLPGRPAMDVTTRLVGRHNVMNMLQALAACDAIGAGDPTRAASHASAPPGRLEPVTGPDDPFAVFVDYAHTDDALEKVLACAGPLVHDRGKPGGGRLWVVFGCGGDRDRTKRPRMGRVAGALADRLVVTSDNPRREDPGSIIREILAGVPGEAREAVHVEPDRSAAIRHAVENAGPGDIVIIAGKGHEREQILPDGSGGTRKIHFDDREEARAALALRGSGDVVVSAGARAEAR